jgi:hypothetical protein
MLLNCVRKLMKNNEKRPWKVLTLKKFLTLSSQVYTRKHLALAANIWLGWKQIAVTNT